MLVVTVRGEIPAGVNYLELMLESSKADWAHEEHGYTTLLWLLKLNEFGLCRSVGCKLQYYWGRLFWVWSSGAGG